jgi:hypothetical protein
MAAPLPNEPSVAFDKQPISVAVDFDAPEGCSDRAHFESGLRARFARIRLVPAGNAAWSLRVRVSPQGNGVYGELRLSDAKGEAELRAVEGADCTGVVEALSLTAALAIEQTVALVESTNAGEYPGGDATRGGAGNAQSNPNAQTPDSGKSPSDVAAAGKTHESSNESSRVIWMRTSVGLFASRLVSPQTSFGLNGEVRFVPNWGSAFHPEFGFGLMFVPVDFMQLKGNVAVDYRAVDLLGCPTRLRLGSGTTLLPCATMDIGRLTVSSRELEVSIPSRRLQFFVGLEGRLSIALGDRFELELRSALRLPTTQRKYISLEPVQELGHSPTVSWLMGLGWNLTW